MGNVKNKKILEGIRNGDKIILTAFYKQNVRYIRNYILGRSGCEEDVEDVFQDALIVIYQKSQTNSFEINCALQTYFYSICKNIWRNRLRKKQKLVLSEELTISAKCDTDLIINDIEKNEQEELYQKCFLKLNDTNKKIMNHYFEGKSMREIAYLMGYSEGYTRKKKFEAKKKLLEIMESDSSYSELKACG